MFVQLSHPTTSSFGGLTTKCLCVAPKIFVQNSKSQTCGGVDRVHPYKKVFEDEHLPSSITGASIPDHDHHGNHSHSSAHHRLDMLKMFHTPTQGTGLFSGILPPALFMSKRSHVGSSYQRMHYGTTSFTVYDKDGKQTRDSSEYPIHEPEWNEIRRDEGSKKRIPSDPRLMTYMLVGATGAVGALSAKSIVFDFLASMSAAADTLAMAQTEVDLSAIPEGKNVIITWRGKPVFIRHRTAAEIEEAETVDVATLRDPETDANRVKRPEWLVMLGIRSHLGCVPVGNSGDYNGWYCPCHGSHYDISGRIRKGPAPLNLEIPEYNFISDDKIVIG